jgi:hypothetical protein
MINETNSVESQIYSPRKIEAQRAMSTIVHTRLQSMLIVERLRRFTLVFTLNHQHQQTNTGGRKL